MAQIMRMDRIIDEQFLESWVTSVGGVPNATKLIKEVLECSKSKAEKIAGVRYPCSLPASEQKILSKLWKVSRDVAFKPVSAGRKANAS